MLERRVGAGVEAECQLIEPDYMETRQFYCETFADTMWKFSLTVEMLAGCINEDLLRVVGVTA